MNRRTVVAVAGIVALGAAGATPALAAAGKHKPKPLHGTWSFTDFTPDASITATNSASGNATYCKGKLPDGPTDKTAYPLKVKGRGTLSVIGHNTGDWAMMVTDKSGAILAGSDGGTPQDQEGLILPVRKAGTYTVTFCNLTGAPTATANYTYKYR